MEKAIQASPEHPILIDRFLEDAHEFDVDAVADDTSVVIGGIMQHIESAGVHSGDRACVLPPYDISVEHLDELRSHTHALAGALNVVGLMNVQFALQDNQVYILEVNPRASRTVPFVSKTIGIPLAKVAARAMVGRSLREQGLTGEVVFDHIAVKEAVLPFAKFPGVDTLLGPEMKSTGEVMGIDTDFGLSFHKAQFGAGVRLPTSGRGFHLGQRPGQGCRDTRCPAAGGTRVSDCRHPWNPRPAHGARYPRRTHPQDPAGPPPIFWTPSRTGRSS